MFCSQCGNAASGKFCWSCGAALQGNVAVGFAGDWSELADYETLLRIPDVREQISMHASRAKQSISAEDFLKHCDKVLAPLLGGVSTAGIASICQPLYAKFGLASTKTQTRLFHAPIGKVIVAVLCSMAERNQQVTEAKQLPDGCLLEANIPSDIYSFAGELTIRATRHQQGTLVAATATIKGQKFDWGKNGRSLEQLFADLHSCAKAA